MRILWQESVALVADDTFGMSIGRRWAPTTFHALGFAWLASRTLLRAFERLSRYGRLINDRVSAALTSDGVTYRFEITLPERAVDASVDATLCALVVMCRSLLGPSFALKGVVLPHVPNGAAVPLEGWLRCPVEYRVGREHLLILEIDRRDMERPLVTANVELVQLNEQWIERYLLRLSSNDIERRVRDFLVAHLPSGSVLEEQVAEALGISKRTMQRRLRVQGATFSHLLEETRKSLAQRYVRDPHLSLSDATYLLGFSDQANFTRAFKRWYGCAPSRYQP
jgi:AraC-like DNA-binding protein